MPKALTHIGDAAFFASPGLTGVYFEGDAPSCGVGVFNWDKQATVYYLPGTTGWGATFAERPTAIWKPLIETKDGKFGVDNGQFGFNLSWASGRTVVVEACTNLASTGWVPLATNTLVEGSSYFSDPDWNTHPQRLYRLLER